MNDKVTCYYQKCRNTFVPNSRGRRRKYCSNTCKEKSFRLKRHATKPQGGIHPTEKPVDLIAYIARSVEGLFLDPFMGSGTLLIACEWLNQQYGHYRRVIGCEIVPEYVALSLERFQRFTKITPERI